MPLQPRPWLALAVLAACGPGELAIEGSEEGGGRDRIDRDAGRRRFDVGDQVVQGLGREGRVLDATRGVDRDGSVARSRADMAAAGVLLVESDALIG